MMTGNATPPIICASSSQEVALEVSFPKVLVLAAVAMLAFLLACAGIGIPTKDPLLVVFVVCMVVVMTPAFAICVSFMLRCKIGSEGLRPAVPTLYQHILRWENMTAVRSGVIVGGPFYVVRGRDLMEFGLLPRAFLLKHPESLRQLLEQYAPTENILRKELTQK